MHFLVPGHSSSTQAASAPRPGYPNALKDKALDYSLKRWQALTRYLVDGHMPIDNN
jgi:hypothetical protein